MRSKLTEKQYDWRKIAVLLLLPVLCCMLTAFDRYIPELSYTARDVIEAIIQEDWETVMQFRDETCPEEKYADIYVIGHSLGSLLALHAAKTHKSIRGLLLLNVPLRPRLKPSMIGRGIRFAFGKVRKDDPVDIQCRNDLGVQLHPYLWKYLNWIPNFLSLLKLARKCQTIPAELDIPCYAYFATDDELVHPNSCKYFHNNPSMSPVMMKGGMHFGYTAAEQATILCGFNDLICQH